MRFLCEQCKAKYQIADEKVAHVKETQAHYLAGTDLGCLMNIAGRMQVLGVPVEAMHIAELVDRALLNDARDGA